ncbi:MAG: hypothetical protein KatS3mg046_324 [Bellilinea sp.]|nr:MAG: hypothetical protein KatS3mg046_324 [Bellilinea sp.]
MGVLITINQILMAGVAITAFSLLLYSLTFNLRERVARSFAMLLFCLVIIYSAESLASVTPRPDELELWLRLQWVGIVFLPSAYLHFSDALLATTGKPSRGKRRWAIRLSYALAVLFLAMLPLNLLVGDLVVDSQPAPYLKPVLGTDLFMLVYFVSIGMAWYNFVRAFRRSATSTSKRRIGYLLVGSIAPVLGSFPFLLFSSTFAAQHRLTFWVISVLTNFLVGGLVVMMAYSVAFFGVALPDRTVKSRLFKWILRGPVTASITLALTTIIRRAGELYGLPYNALVPIVMVASILTGQYLVTLTFPMLERWLFYGNDKEEIEILRNLEQRLITRNDLRQFLEMILAAVCDRLQVKGAYVVALKSEGLEIVVRVGKTFFDEDQNPAELESVIRANHLSLEMFNWGDDLLIPLVDQNEEGAPDLIGLLGISGAAGTSLDEDQIQVINSFRERVLLALKDRRLQEGVFRSISELTTKTAYIQQLQAAGRYDQSGLLSDEIPLAAADFSQWVKDALTHYWGGPKLTESPLTKLKIVQAMLNRYDGNTSNALRAILREAIERVRPEGERRFTGEWVLYNILEMKFLEGKKVREIAMRLAMSEADLYRKQRVAIEAVARAILEMESQNGHANELPKSE